MAKIMDRASRQVDLVGERVEGDEHLLRPERRIVFPGVHEVQILGVVVLAPLGAVHRLRCLLKPEGHHHAVGEADPGRAPGGLWRGEHQLAVDVRQDLAHL